MWITALALGRRMAVVTVCDMDLGELYDEKIISLQETVITATKYTFL
jgi:hypothetical protein